MAFPFMLLAAQAAGIGLNIWQHKRESKFERIGYDIERQETQLQMEQEALASSQQSLHNAERLRDILATQRAIFAARGQKAGVGSALSIGQSSIHAFNADEHARRLSLSFRKHQLESAQRLKSIGLYAAKSQRKFGLLEKGLNLLSFNALAGGLGGGAGTKLNG